MDGEILDIDTMPDDELEILVTKLQLEWYDYCKYVEPEKGPYFFQNGCECECTSEYESRWDPSCDFRTSPCVCGDTQ